MPELPEVETITRGLERKIKGKVLTDITVLDSVGNISKDLSKQKGFEIVELARRGKYIIISLSNNNSLIIHLRMSGQFLFDLEKSGSATRVIFKLSSNSGNGNTGSVMYFNDFRKFGTIDIVKTEELKTFFEKKGLGPEPLTENFTLSLFKEILSRKPKSKIKNLLLDQKIIAGLGNIYAQEACFLAGIVPERKVETLKGSEMEKLYSAIRDILNKAIEFNGTSFDTAYVTSEGEAGKFSQFLNVYHQRVCKRCKNDIMQLKMNSRGTCYCNTCQK